MTAVELPPPWHPIANCDQLPSLLHVGTAISRLVRQPSPAPAEESLLGAGTTPFGISNPDFAETLPSILLFSLFVCYFIQCVIVIRRADEGVEARQRSPGRDQNDERAVRLRDVVRHHDGGLRDAWTFFLLAVFCPVLLTGIGDMIPLTSGDWGYNAGSSAALYFACLATIGVLITLELSHVYHLRRNANEWIPMLVVAIALDILTLLIFFTLIGHPATWLDTGDGTLTGMLRWMMSITTVIALYSSLVVLVYARAAGALSDEQVDLADVARRAGRVTKRQSDGGE